MSFQLRDFQSLTLGMINYFRANSGKVTDFVPGSVVRTLLEAPATEIEEFYLQVFLGLRDAIPVSVYRGFSFDLLGARYASGWASVARVTAGTAVPVPVWTQFTADDGRAYVSTVAGTIGAAAGASVVVPVRAVVAGLAGNGAAGVITGSQGFSAGQYVVSSGPITGGADAETDAERATRFVSYVAGLSRGTEEAVRAAVARAMLTDSLGAALEWVIRTGYREVPGRVWLYAYGNMGVPSADLVAAAQALIDGVRDPLTDALTGGIGAAGIQVEVVAMTERAVGLTAGVRMLPGYALDTAKRQEIGDAYGAVVRSVPSGGLVTVGTVVGAMQDVSGVLSVELTGAVPNFACGANEALVPGSLVLESLV